MSHLNEYWTRYVPIGERRVQGHAQRMYFKVHTSQERYYNDDAELFPIQQRQGQRLYVHAKPIIVYPSIILTISLSSPQPTGEIGRVMGAEELPEGREQEIGNAQAWYYPEDRAIVLWECFVNDWVRTGSPATDPLHRHVWTNFERLLGEQLPDAHHIYTTHEPIYDREDWRSFLESAGYQAIGKAVFVREL